MIHVSQVPVVQIPYATMEYALVYKVIMGIHTSAVDQNVSTVLIVLLTRVANEINALILASELAELTLFAT